MNINLLYNESQSSFEIPQNKSLSYLYELSSRFSTRSLIPQRKNPDGSIDQTGIGRYVCSDRVYLPSHKEAYINKNIPVKNICKANKFESVMESYVADILNRSDKVNRILDGMQPAMESAPLEHHCTFLSAKKDCPFSSKTSSIPSCK